VDHLSRERKHLGGTTRAEQEYSTIHKLPIDELRESGWPDLTVINPRGVNDDDAEWKEWIAPAKGQGPPLVLLVDPLSELLGSRYRTTCKYFEKRGYITRTWTAFEEDCGAAVRQGHLLTMLFKEGTPATSGTVPTTLDLGLPPRGFGFALSDYKVHPKQFKPLKYLQAASEKAVPNFRGSVRGAPVFDPTGPVDGDPSSLIVTERGIRRLSVDEWKKLKGLPSSWTIPARHLDLLVADPGLHIWSVLGQVLQDLLQPGTRTSTLLTRLPREGIQTWGDPTATPDNGAVHWSPPDLREGGAWYRRTISKLETAIADEPDKGRLREEAKTLLAAHRENYGETGPKNLVNLWWEWPREHWVELRDGASMNFLEFPAPGLVDNPTCNPGETDAMVKFCDELISLGVLEEVPEGAALLNNCPMFTEDKPGQPGQLRCIADAKRGGQNDCCGADPVHLPTPQDILPHLYPGGYSAVIDASKYFHCFLTREDERPYLGMVHPRTGKHYWYRRLPMGTSNSPAVAGRFGTAFLRMVMEGIPEFTGRPIPNDFATAIEGKGFDPRLGVGRVLLDGDDGTPACWAWIHVDDVFIHAPTKAKLEQALSKVLDLTTRLGLICQPAKTSGPKQVQCFCGFLYDTTSIPRLRIPDNKVQRALGMVACLRHDLRTRWSRLALAVVIGTLQSLVPATPNNIGASFLTHLYEDLHRADECDHACIQSFYASVATLSGPGRADLDWWASALAIPGGLRNQLQVREMGHIGLAFGDGSGEGTGGSTQIVSTCSGPLPVMETWMGSWTPRVHSFVGGSSNYREISTIILALRRELREWHQDRMRGHLFLYFTDNDVTYNIVRKGCSRRHHLHLKVQELKLLELELGCRVEVIHVPGTTMIRQGSDNLSRGVWVTPLNTSFENVAAAVFRPAPPSVPLLSHVVSLSGSPLPTSVWEWRTDLDDWRTSTMVGRHVVWSLSPSLARQGISAGVAAWVESPWNSSHIFIVPRVTPRAYGRVNRHVLFLGQVHDLPLPADFDPLVPFFVFYLPPFRKRLRAHADVDSAPRNRLPKWVQAQVDHLRGL